MADILSDKIKKQAERWRDSYLNSSIKRNNLLNMNPNRTSKSSDSVRLKTDGNHSLKDLWEIAADRGESEYPFRSYLRVQRDPSNIDWEVEGPRQYADAIKKIAASGLASITQKGENPICLAFGKILWHVACESPSDGGYGETFKKEYGGETHEFVKICTPLILVPVKISNVGEDRCWLHPVAADSNEATINPVFLKKFQSEGYKNFPLPRCGQSIDFSYDSKDFDSFDIDAYFEKISTFLKEELPEFSFDKDYVGLDIFDYSRICMYRDVSSHMEEITKNPVIRQIFGEMRRDAYLRDLDLKSGAEIQDELDAEKSFQILESDSSQCEAIERFKHGESFVLQGPPGTGKTQTIVNMLAEASKAGKKVLFVSGKMSALDTVMKKLRLLPGVNIDKHFLLITGEDETKSNDVGDTYGKLKSSLNAPRPQISENAYKQNLANLKFSKEFLSNYNKELYSSANSLKMSVYDICGRMLLLGYKGDYIRQNLDSSFLKSLSCDTLTRLVTDMERMQNLALSVTRDGKICDNVWFGLLKDEFGDEDEARLGEISIKIKREKDALAAKMSPTLSGDLFDLSFSAVKCLENMSDADAKRLAERKLGDDESALEREIKRSKKYLPVLERYNMYATVFPDLGESDLTGKKIAIERCVAFYASEIGGMLSGCQKILDDLSRASVSKELMLENISVFDLDALIETMDSAEKAREDKKKIKEDIARFYDEKIFDFDYKPLLSKMRTSYRDKLFQNKAPMGFKKKIRRVMEACKSADADFSMRYVYELLSKLDSVSHCDEIVAAAGVALERYGLDGGSAFEERCLLLDDLLKEYREEKRDLSRGNFYGKFGFKDFVSRKRDDYASVSDALKLFKVERNVKIGELENLVDDYEKLKTESDRLDLDLQLRDILPSMYMRAETNWKAILEIVKLFEKGDEAKRDMAALKRSRLGDAMGSMKDEYEAFYSYSDWFGAGRSGEGLSCNGFLKWADRVTDRQNVRDFVAFNGQLEKMREEGSGEFFDEYVKRGEENCPLKDLAKSFEISLLYMYQENLVASTKTLSQTVRGAGENLNSKMRQTFSDADAATVEYNRKFVDLALSGRISKKSARHSYLETQTRDKSYSVRKLLKFRRDSVTELAPCMLMSVYSVSKLLPYELYEFDAVIFDEASQIPEEDAITSIMRTKKQVVIAGDPKQMPAISYFKPKEQELVSGDDEESYSCASIIDYIMTVQGTAMGFYPLTTHYRSNHESLIKYSNDNPQLYGGELVTFPSPKERSEDFGIWNYCLCDEGGKITSADGQNEREAKKVLDLVRAHFEKYPLPDKNEEDIESYNRDRSLGVIVFGTKQKQKILDMMAKDETLRKISEYGDDRVFSVTPVDDIQGDEMAYMILSLTYGRNADGAISSSWGHMNRLPVALYKFNVAVTRAKDNLKFVHSLRSSDIYSMGTRSLDYVAEYLRQFDDSSPTSFRSDTGRNTDFVSAVGKICEDVVGKDRVVYNFGASEKSYRVPISILSKEKDKVVLGIMCEEDRGKDVSLRESVRSYMSVLRSHGWDNLVEANIMQWVGNYVRESEKLVEKLREIV